MKILVTGATGLVGARLLPRLAKTGMECRALVRRGRELPVGIEGIEGDLFDQAALAQAVDGVSAIIHLAAVFRTQDTDLIWKSNLDGTRGLIAATEAHAPNARFIMSSTSNVYNKDGAHPGRETDAVEPVLAYPASKIAAEQALRESVLNWSILRFPFVYGDGDGHLEALPKHLGALGLHPANRMSTIHHRDIATAMNMALAGAFDGRTVNISDEAPTTLYELVGLVGEAMPSSSEPLKNPWHLHVDASVARSLRFQSTVRTVYQAAQEELL